MRDIATRPSEAVERSLYPAIGLYIDELHWDKVGG